MTTILEMIEMIVNSLEKTDRRIFTQGPRRHVTPMRRLKKHIAYLTGPQKTKLQAGMMMLTSWHKTKKDQFEM